MNNCIALLEQRGVSIEDIAEIVMLLQAKYIDGLSLSDCISSVYSVLEKREVQNTIMTGIELDLLAEQGKLNNKQLEKMLLEDAGLYGIDEVMAYSICNLFGSIALTNFGYVDKTKYGVIDVLNNHPTMVHTFLDDIIGAIAASAASRLAHRNAQ